MFGKSFDDIGNAIIQKIVSIKQEFAQTGNLLDAFKNSDSIFQTLYPNRGDVRSRIIDVDSVLPEIDESKAREFLSWIEAIENGTDNTYESFQQLYDTGNRQNQYIAQYAQATQNQIRSTEGVIEANQRARQAIIDQNNALRQQTLSFKVSTLAAKTFSLALNTALSIGASFVISGIISSIDKFINAAKYAKEAMDEAQSAIDDAQSNLKNISSTLSENKERFLELSEGVNKYSKNLRLSEEDYKEYLSISNKLAELFPTLVSGYDEQGNALLTLGDNAEETGAKLQELLEIEQISARKTLIDNMDDVAKGIFYDITEIQESINELESEKKKLQQEYNNRNIDLSQQGQYISFRGEDATDYSALMQDALSASGVKFETDGYDTIKILAFTKERLQEAQKLYNAFINTENEYYKASINGLERDIKEKQKLLDNSYSKMTANLQVWIQDNYNYQYLPDSSSSIVDMLIPEIKWNELEDPPVDASDYQDYIENNILKPLMEIPEEHKQKVNDMFYELLNLEDSDLYVVNLGQQIQNKLDALYEEGKLNARIDISPIFSDAQSTKDRLDASVSAIAGQNEEDLDILLEYTKDFDKAQVNAWLSVTKNCKSATSAIQQYEKYLESLKEKAENITISSTIEDLNKKLKPALDSLADAYNDIFTDDGFTLKNVGIDMLTSVRDALTELNEVGVDIDTSSFENFADVLSDTNSTANDVHKVFNSFVSEIINTSDTTKFTAETFDVLTQSLEAMGVTNAKEVLQEIKNVQEQLVEKGYALEEITDEQVVAFLNEAEASDVATQYLKNYVLEKEIANNPLDTSADIQQLENLCNTLAVTGDMLHWVNQLKQGQDLLDRKKAGEDIGMPTPAINAQISTAEEQIRKLASKGSSYKFDGSKNVSSNKGSSSSSDKDTTETFDWIERKVSDVQREVTNLGKVVDATYEDWTDRNTALLEQMSAIKDEIEVQEKAYNAYMKKANSVGLSDYYKGLVQSGDYSIQDITDEKLQEKIKKYQEWYDKAISAQDAIADLEADLANLTVQKFDNLANQYENRLSDIEHRTNTVNNLLDNATASEKYAHYDSLIGLEKENISVLKEQYATLGEELRNALSGGNIEEGSEDWQKMTDQITAIEESIQESTNNLYDLAKQKFDNIVTDFENKLSAIENEANIINALLEQSTTSEKDTHYSSLIELEKESLILLQEQYAELNKELQEAIDSGVAINSDAWIEMNEQITSVNESILETKNNIADLAKQKFDNIAIGYDNQLGNIEHEVNTTNNTLDVTTSDKKAGYYDKLIGLEKSNISILKQKYEELQQELQNALDTGHIEKYDDTWKEMHSTIRDVEETIQEAQNNLSDLAVQRFNSIAQEYENQLDAIERKAESINSTLEQATVSEKDKHYVSLMYLEKQNAATLEKEYKALQNSLQNALDTGYITKYSDAWYELTNKIKDTEQAIQDSKLALTDLVKQRFDNITSKYEDEFNANEHETNTINASLEVAISGESSGYYDNLVDIEEENISLLKKKYAELQQALKFALDNGYVREYDDTWREMNATITEVEESIQEATNNLSELTLQKFNSIAEDFENKMSLIEHKAESINNSLEGATLDQKDAHYDSLIDLELDNAAILKEEYDSLGKQLQDALDSGYIEKYDDAWYEMTGKINETEEAIQEVANSIADLTMNKFENMLDKYEIKLNDIEHRVNTINNSLDSSTHYERNASYNSLIGLEKNNTSVLKQEYANIQAFLKEQLSKGYIKQGDDNWHTINDELTSIEEAIQESTNNIADLAKQKFDNVVSAFEDQLGIIEHKANMVNSFMEDATSSGKNVYYDYLIDLEKDSVALLKKEYSDLQSSLDNSVKNGYIEEYSEEWHEMTDQIDSVRESIQDSINNISDLTVQKFDNIVNEFESRISLIEHEASILDGYIAQTEARGYMVSTKYYERLMEIEQSNLKQLNAEYDSLKSALQEGLDSGVITAYNDDWYEMTNQILEVEKAIQDSNTSVLEFMNNIRELKWEVFDKVQEMVSDLYDESNFIIGLIDDKKMFDDEGQWTEHADAKAGLHAVNYNAYMAQANAYAKEIENVNKELASDPNNLTLLERRQELLELQQDMISSAEQEKQSIKDLVADGYDAMLKALNEIIEKRREALQAEKDLYDYEKKVAEHNKTIGSLEKQLISYENDNSEEAQSKIQQLRVSLENEKQALQEAEYERYLSDSEIMLDKILSDTELFISEKLDNLDAVIREVIDATNLNAESIKQTIDTVTQAVGYTLTERMDSIWTTGAELKEVVTMYDANFNMAATTTNTAITAIQELIQSMMLKSDEQAMADIQTQEQQKLRDETQNSILQQLYEQGNLTNAELIQALGQLYAQGDITSDELLQALNQLYMQGDLTTDELIQAEALIQEQNKLKAEEQIQSLEQLKAQDKVIADELLQSNWQSQEQDKVLSDSQLGALDGIKEQDKVLSDEQLGSLDNIKEQDKLLSDEQLGALGGFKDQEQLASDNLLSSLESFKQQEGLNDEAQTNLELQGQTQDKLIAENQLSAIEQFKNQEKSNDDSQLSVLEQIKEQARSKWDSLLSYVEQIKSTISSISGTIGTISGNVASYKSSLDKISTSSGSSSSSSGNNGSSGSSNTGNDSNSSSWGSWFIYKKNKFPTSKLDVDKSVVDRLKYHDYDSSESARALYYEAMGLGSASSYEGTYSQNIAMLKLMKEHGYKVGSKNIKKDQVNWVHDGEIVYRPSDGGMLIPLEQNGKVFTKEMANNLWDMAQSPNLFGGITTATLPHGFVNNKSSNNIQNDLTMSINMYGVQDVNGLVNELTKHKGFEKIVKTMTVGAALGGNSMSKYKY